MKKEKRVVKGYKIQESFYKKAMKRAKKEKFHLSTLVEHLVIAYANGNEIRAIAYKDNTAIASGLDFIAPKVQ